MTTNSNDSKNLNNGNNIVPKKLLIVGNGFDLNLHLQSKFINFVNNVVNYKANQESINYHLNNIAKSLRMFQLPSLFIHDNHTLETDNNYSYLLDLLEQAIGENTNFWVKYLLVRRITFKDKISEWKDIEQVLYDFFKIDDNSYINIIIDIMELDCIKTYYRKAGTENFLNFIKNKDNISENDFNEMFLITNIIVSMAKGNSKGSGRKLFNYLNSTRENFESEFGHAIRLMNDDSFNPIKESKMLEKSKKKHLKNLLITYLRDELESFETEFNNYMFNKEQSNVYKKASNDFLKQIFNNESFSILDFNYTTPNTNSLKCTSIVHIHGKLFDSKKSYRPKDSPIIGIDSIDIPLDQEEYIFTKSFRTITAGTIKDFHKILSPTINEIFIFGHSFSDPDYVYFEKIFNYYDISSLKTKITLLFTSRKKESDEEIKRNILSSFTKLLERYCLLSNHQNSNDLILNLSIHSKLSFKKIQ